MNKPSTNSIQAHRIALLLLAIVLSLVSPVYSLDLHQTLPSATSSQFNSQNQTFLQREDANRLDDMWGTGWVVSNCLGATSGTKVMAAFACTAYTRSGFYVNQVAASIDFGASPGPACADADTAWVIGTMDTTATPGGNFVRVTGTRYAVDCTTVTQPAVPADAVPLMEVAISGAALTTVTDLRKLRTPVGLIPIETYGSFAAAIAEHNDAGDPPVTLVVGSRMHVTASSTITANITLMIVPPGALDLDAGVTLTFAVGSTFVAPPIRVFYGTGIVAWGGNAIAHAFPEWCGALGDDATDNQAAIQRCAVTYTGVRRLRFLGGTYRITTSAVAPAAGQIWEGQGEGGYTIIRQMTANINALTLTNSGVSLRDFEARGGSGTGNGITIDATAGTVSNVYVDNVRVRSSGQDGFSILGGSGGYKISFRNVEATGNGRDGFRCAAGSDNVRIEDSAFSSNTLNGINLIGCQNVFVGHTTLESNTGDGLEITGTGTAMTGVRVHTEANAQGFDLQGAGVMSCFGCRAQSNTSHGFNVGMQATLSDAIGDGNVGNQIRLSVNNATLINPTGTITDVSANATSVCLGGSCTEAHLGSSASVRFGVSATTTLQMAAANTQAVGAGATTIYGTMSSFGSLFLITGFDTAASNSFFEMVLAGNSATAPATIHSFTLAGAPATRTYTRSSDDLQLAMGASTYDITVWVFNMPDPR